jgi:S1-C subfamily serine protease
MKRVFLLLFILIIVVSCNLKNGDLEIENDAKIDLFGNNNTNTEVKEKQIKPKSNSTLNTAEKLLKASVNIYSYLENGELVSSGSGAFINANLIVTNLHVIEKGSKHMFNTNDNKTNNKLIIYKIDPIHDIAILKSSYYKSDLFLNLVRKFPKIGDEILVCGAPEGLEGTISNGIVSSIRKNKPYDFDLIQFTAPISFGSSGGPLINNKMELIGITVSGIDRNDAQNLNFAVPSKYIINLLDLENN